MCDPQLPAVPPPSAADLLGAIGVRTVDPTLAFAALDALFGYWTPAGGRCCND